MDLFLAGDSIAVSGQPRVEFIVSFRSSGGKRNECGFIGAAFNIQVYAMHDDAFQITYYPEGKRLVSQYSIPQSAKCEVSSQPHQRVKM